MEFRITAIMLNGIKIKTEILLFFNFNVNLK